jgi:hypothetical protein
MVITKNVCFCSALGNNRWQIQNETATVQSDCLMADATGNTVVRGVFGFGYPAESFSKRIWADVISRRFLIVRFSHGEPLFIFY